MSASVSSFFAAPVRTVFVRWCRFNLVGLIGMAFQLAAVAILERLFTAHPLLGERWVFAAASPPKVSK